MSPPFHMGIPIWKWGLMHPRFHMGTVQSLTRFHTVSVNIWGSRKNPQMKIVSHLDSPIPYEDHCMETGRQKKSHLGTPHFHTVFVSIWGLTYTVCMLSHAIRYGRTYNYSHHNEGPCPDAQCASITNWLGPTVQYQSLALVWLPWHVYSPNRFLDTLAAWENQSLWKHICIWIDGAMGDWIFSGSMCGSLVIWNDGLYMLHLSNNV
jgi:hypothetical protein